MHYVNRQSNHFAQLIGFDTSNLAMLLKFYELGSLRQLIHSQLPFNRTQILHILRGISLGLRTMHSNGFAHCDIKTDNILMDLSDDRRLFIPFITDLGITRVLTNTAMGVREFQTVNLPGFSVRYAAPEILKLRRLPVDTRATWEVQAADIYAMGCLVYEVMCRTTMWNANQNNTKKIVTK